MKQFVIPSVFTAIDKFSKPVDRMTKKTDASFARMDRNLRKVSKTAFGVAQKSAMVGAAIIAPLALFANEAIGFETSMANVSTLIDTNAESIEDMGNKVLALSTKLPVPIEELTASLYDIRSAGIAADKQFEVLEASAKLSAAGLSTVEEATNLTTSAINAFAKEGKSANEINNILFKTVKFGKTTVAELSQAFGSVAPIIESSGTSLADFSAATAALTTLGTPASQAQNQLKASIVSLQKPSAEMTKVFGKLGVTTEKELIQKFGGLVGGFEAVNGAIEDMGLNAAKTWRSTEALGAVTSLTGATNEAYLTTLDAMSNGVDDLGTAYDKQAKTGKAQMQIAKNNMQSLAITLGQTLIPIITQLVEAVTPVLKRFSAWAKANKSTVATIMKVLAVVGGLAFAVSGISFAIGIASKAMIIFNMIMAANPVGLVVIGVLALGAALYAVSTATNKVSTAQKLNNEVTSRALDNTIDQRVEVTMLFKALRKAEEGTTAYNDTLLKLEQLQPGIVEKYNLQTKAIENINAAEKDLINTIMQRAKLQATEDLILEKTKRVVEIEDKGLGLGETISKGGLLGLFFKEDVATEQIDKINKEIEMLADKTIQLQNDPANGGNGLNAINSEKTKQDSQNNFIETTTKNQVELTIKNETGNKIEQTGGNSNGFNFPQMTPTTGQ